MISALIHSLKRKMYMRRKLDFLVMQHIRCFNLSKKLRLPAYENDAEALIVASAVDWMSTCVSQ